MTFKQWMENWDAVGAGFTPEEVDEAGVRLRSALRNLVKRNGTPRTDTLFTYQNTPHQIGVVATFFPRAQEINPQLAAIRVVFDPTYNGAAKTNGAEITIGKHAFRDGIKYYDPRNEPSTYKNAKDHIDSYRRTAGKTYRGMSYKTCGSSGSLADTFAHEVEHCYDVLTGQYLGGKGMNTPVGKRYVSEFTPRLRQMLRQLKDQPEFRIWNYLHKKLGYEHARNYVSHHLEALYGGYDNNHIPTEDEIDFAAKAVMKRAQEIYNRMIANGEL